MIHGYDMTVTLAEQHRSDLEAEAARWRLARGARRARRVRAPRGANQRLLRARIRSVLTQLHRRRATNTCGPMHTIDGPSVHIETEVTT